MNTMTQNFTHKSYDAIIIGARCAGAASGMLMARNGARVLIVDREAEVRDALSTHALMRPAVTLLDQWGLLDQIAMAETPVVRSTHFHYGSDRIDIPIKPVGNAEGLYAPRRWLLDRVLRDATVDAGAELRTGISLHALVKNSFGRIIGADLRHPNGDVERVFSGIVIGADGRHSVVAAGVGAKTLVESPHGSATAYTYVDGIPNEGYRWYYGDGIAAGLIPTNNGLHCLFTSCAPRAFKARFKNDPFNGAMNILSTWEPEIATGLSARGPVERMRRYPGSPGHIRECAGPGWALVGDAGYFKDPATAHGITDAFLDANRLARALSIKRDDACGYQAERDWIAPTFFELTQKIASLNWDFDALKSLHMELNLCMKAEQQALVSAPIALAA
jgi:2-polyprenyl-6-methoxyphenol hydroxylase-like FAD-dependent oxidoreductase